MTEFTELHRAAPRLTELASPAPCPSLAVVGRPNVGKSTLVNRILGRREAVVQDVPGRDPRPGRLRRDLERPPLHGRRHRRLGAGRPRAAPRRSPRRPRSPSRPPTRCCSSSTRPSAPTDTDEAVVRVLRRAGKPVVLVANKVDDAQDRGRRRRAVVARARRALRRLRACTGEAVATCSTRCSPRCPRRRADLYDAGGRASAGGAARSAQRRQVEPAQPARGRRAGRRRLGRRHDRATRSTS